MTDMTKYQSLIGKEISADGWQRDNSGGIYGEITRIQSWSRDEVIVHATKEYEWNMNSFSFTIEQMDELVEKGCLPKANKMLNSGTNASIK